MERAGERPVVEADLAGRREHAAEREHRGGLAGAVGAEQRDELAGADVQVDAVHDRDVAVAGREALDLEHQAGVPR